MLAGGFGTRLRSVVSDVPKPLAPVAGRPYLYYLIENWVAQGVTRLVFLLHHRAEMIQRFLKQQEVLEMLKECELHTLIESQPLGTGGAVAYAVQEFRLKESFLVTNADTWLGKGVDKLVATEIPAVGVVRVCDTERYGRVCIEQDRIVAFEEKKSNPEAGWINAGLYHLYADLFNGWSGDPFSLEGELFPRLAGAGQLMAVPLQAEFIDIGIPNDYLRFCRWVESEKVGVL